MNGYKDFNNQYINPTLQNIRNSAPDEDAYDVGYAVGTILPIASGLIGIIDKAGKISSIGNIASVTGGVAVGGVTIDASSAMGLIKSFTQASIGVGVSETSGNNKPTNNNNNNNESRINIENDIIGKPKVGSATKLDDYHNFNKIVDNYAGMATKTKIDNGVLYQLKGALNGVEGRFEWILQDGNVTHRMFIAGGEITGIPIKP